MRRSARLNMGKMIFDGIEFDDVKDLIAYKRMIASGEISAAEEVEEIEAPRAAAPPPKTAASRAAPPPARQAAPAPRPAPAKPAAREVVEDELEFDDSKNRKQYKDGEYCHQPWPDDREPLSTKPVSKYVLDKIERSLGGQKNLMTASEIETYKKNIEKQNEDLRAKGVPQQNLRSTSWDEVFRDFLADKGLVNSDDHGDGQIAWAIYKTLEKYNLLASQTRTPRNPLICLFGGMKGKMGAPQVYTGRINLAAAICRLYGVNVEPFNRGRDFIDGDGLPEPTLDLDEKGNVVFYKEIPGRSQPVPMPLPKWPLRNKRAKANPTRRNSMWLRGY